eukprot:CAMPEP_0174744850 /NCGR_PEP_ID=MMETSP1094-20130205/85463_1 /TAXON_ID=156173 /ORGANISM="Chrysochromulina brevifilum, Strain UTEX LB 985" /LENGTH=66 /DNA_ID=CAMNT_0015949321 /DNA_START=1 /DNA_END=198 /DNA_ORIENTATION=-
MLACEQHPHSCGGVVEDKGMACGCHSELLRFSLRASKNIPPLTGMTTKLLTVRDNQGTSATAAGCH